MSTAQHAVVVLAFWSFAASLIAGVVGYYCGRRHGFLDGASRIIHAEDEAVMVEVREAGAISDGEAVVVQLRAGGSVNA